ncbi:FRG domain-containing protein [Cobetia sp. MMG027]|uniref:FRG domain-containing protein n=1 Tax=Cobetia sp. MMG027 TaxID=3021980 RepID=UPI0022FE3599|nr:FRG domain-containing protein [Cobetia sp. MMG027]MDA5564328.1 FRG domain-containing protein [Cobetia sp. MMG027]
MVTHSVKGFNDLHSVLSQYRTSNKWVFRGHESELWELKPRAGRAPYNKSDDLVMFKAWKRRAIEYVNSSPTDDWDWLAIAQHHGLVTRLLDWSLNPLVAVFFAIANKPKSGDKACMYAYYPNRYIDAKAHSPSSFEGVALLKPNGVAPRISRQGGLFTMHGAPSVPLNESMGKNDKLEKIIFEPECIKDLIFEINHYGINYASIFPDLDGLSRHVNWHTENAKYWMS